MDTALEKHLRALEDNNFQSAYAILNQMAQDIQRAANQDPPDIEGLVDRVKIANQAYKVAKQRLDAVEKELESAMQVESNDSAPRIDAPEQDEGLEPDDDSGSDLPF